MCPMRSILPFMWSWPPATAIPWVSRNRFTTALASTPAGGSSAARPAARLLGPLREQRPADRLRSGAHRGTQSPVARVHVREALFLHHGERLAHREHQAHRGRERALPEREALPRLAQIDRKSTRLN